MKTIAKQLFIASCILGCVLSCSKDSSSPSSEPFVLDEVDDVCSKMDDLKFMKYCYDKFDVNNDSKISMAEAAAVKSITIKSKGIQSLKGIEYFTSIEELDCNSNDLTSLDLRNNTALTIIDCRWNDLTVLKLGKSVKYLECSYNQLTALDVSNCPTLERINCSCNQLKSLDVSKNTKLSLLNCCYNPDLIEIWLKKGQTIIYFVYDSDIATIKYKD